MVGMPAIATSWSMAVTAAAGTRNRPSGWSGHRWRRSDDEAVDMTVIGRVCGAAQGTPPIPMNSTTPQDRQAAMRVVDSSRQFQFGSGPVSTNRSRPPTVVLNTASSGHSMPSMTPSTKSTVGRIIR
jgi:hypothetical protein